MVPRRGEEVGGVEREMWREVCVLVGCPKGKEERWGEEGLEKDRR